MGRGPVRLLQVGDKCQLVILYYSYRRLEGCSYGTLLVGIGYFVSHSASEDQVLWSCMDCSETLEVKTREAPDLQKQ